MKLPKLNLKEKVSKAGAAATHKLISARKIAAVMLAASLVLSIGFLASPSLRKKSAINSAGSDVMTDMKLIPEIIAYYDGDNLATLSKEPSNAAAYSLVSDALAKVRKTGGYDSVMLIVRSGKQYLCAADSLLGSGQNVYGAGSLLSPDKAVKNLLNKIYDGKSAGGIASDVIESRMGSNSACVLLPVNGINGEVIGVISVETAVRGAPFHIAGAVNLYIVGGVFAVIAVLMALMLFMIVKLMAKTGSDPAGTAAAAAATVAAKTADTAIKKAVQNRVKKAEEKAADKSCEKPADEEKKAPLSAAEIAGSIFGRKKKDEEVNSSNVAQKYPAPEFNDTSDFDTPEIPPLSLPGEEDDV